MTKKLQKNQKKLTFIKKNENFFEKSIKAKKNMCISSVNYFFHIRKRMLFRKFHEFCQFFGGSLNWFFEKIGSVNWFFWKKIKKIFCDFLTIWARTELNRISKNQFFWPFFGKKFKKNHKNCQKLPKITLNWQKNVNWTELNWFFWT